MKEARENYSDYVSQFLTQEELEKGLLDIIFTDRYFGELKRFERELNPKDPLTICKDDGLIFTHIFNAWMPGSPKYCPGQCEGTLENAKKKWSLAVQLLHPKEVFEAFKKDRMKYVRELESLEFDSDDERIKAIFNDKHFGVPLEESARRAHFLENGLAFLSQDLIRNIYEVAVKIMSQSSPGDTLAIFGNTPYFVRRALHHLISNDPEKSNFRTIIEFPFSGAPGQIRGGNNWPNKKNILIRERLAHLQARMRSVRVSSDHQQLRTHATYFIDVVSSGGGIAFTAEQILRDFQSKGLELPNLNVITIRKINIHDEDDPRNASIAEENPDQNGHTTLYFPNLENRHFSIDCYEIY